MKNLKYSLLFFSLVFILNGCGNNQDSKKESCKQLHDMEDSQLASRNTLAGMDEEHSSDATKTALANADDALDILQDKISKECKDEDN